jgi:hypothetical protein
VGGGVPVRTGRLSPGGRGLHDLAGGPAGLLREQDLARRGSLAEPALQLVRPAAHHPGPVRALGGRAHREGAHHLELVLGRALGLADGRQHLDGRPSRQGGGLLTLEACLHHRPLGGPGHLDLGSACRERLHDGEHAPVEDDLLYVAHDLAARAGNPPELDPEEGVRLRSRLGLATSCLSAGPGSGVVGLG